MFPRLKIGGGDLLFCPVCHSVNLSKTLAMLAYNFSTLSGRHFTWIFLVICSFCWYWTNPFRFDIFLNYISHNIITNIRTIILHMSIFCDTIFLTVHCIKIFVLVTWQILELAIIRSICVSRTHLFFSFIIGVMFVFMMTRD